MLPVSPVAGGGAFPTNDTGGQRGRQDPLSTSPPPSCRHSLALPPSLPVARFPSPAPPIFRTALHLRCGDRDRDSGRAKGMGEREQGRSDDGDDARRNERWEEGEDINGGQGRHIESLSLIFAQRGGVNFFCSRGR